MHLKCQAITEWADLQNLLGFHRMQKFHSALFMLLIVNKYSADVKFWTRYHVWIHFSGLGTSADSVSKTAALCCVYFKSLYHYDVGPCFMDKLPLVYLIGYKLYPESRCFVYNQFMTRKAFNESILRFSAVIICDTLFPICSRCTASVLFPM